MTEDEKQMGIMNQFIKKSQAFFNSQGMTNPNVFHSKGLIQDAQIGIIIGTLKKNKLITDEEITQQLKDKLNQMEEDLLSNNVKPMPNPDAPLGKIFGN